MTAEARCFAPTVTNGAALEMDGIEGVPRERIEAAVLRSIGGCLIYALNAAGHVLTWSPGAERIKGCTARSLKIVFETKDKLEREFERPL